ncbi:minor capsid protein [Tissierella sp. MB52-C2]|uniref:minor capsid protein n=1 Tax=Tissierella sp. MB52-C2 TaxID=3070999 RepID=UPI00280AAABA|nr:minor capsid protein [Tissierella sp. MB52-C2]WMM24057.1 minor capsid protein [Tissierella sp. MB52-C2]
MTRTNKYWNDRFTLLTESLLKKGERYYQYLEIEYKRAISSIQKDLRDFYGRYGEDISYADTKKLLTPQELREFKLNMGDYMDVADRERISRLHSLQYQIRQQIDIISATRLKGLTRLSEELIRESYYRSIYEVQKGFGIGDTFTVLDTRTVESIIAKPWVPDGSNFSERVWRDREVLMNELQKELAQSFIRGDGPDMAIRNISKKMEVSKRAAGRLVMTESAFFANESRARAFKELGVEEYQFLATLDMRTSDICQDMDLRIFKLSEREIGVNWPPLHVWCRSTVVPCFEGNIKQRWARDPKTGKGYYVPGDMKYKDWYKEHVV